MLPVKKILFLTGMSALALCLALLAGSRAPGRRNAQPGGHGTPPAIKCAWGSVFAEAVPAAEKLMPGWVKMWEGLKPGFDISAFEKSGEVRFHGLETPLYPAQRQPRKFLYALSPCGTKAVDPHGGIEIFKREGAVSAAFGPDSEAMLIDFQENKSVRVAFCGTPCAFHDAAWIDERFFILAGASESESPPETALPGAPGVKPVIFLFDAASRSGFLYTGPLVKDISAARAREIYFRKLFPGLTG